MARRLKQRLRELEEIALQAQVAAANNAASAHAERARAEERELALIMQAERESNDLRQSFDEALERAGVVLFQTSSSDAESFYVSTSMQAALGWAPSSFLQPGVLRGIVHSDDLRTFDAVMAAGAVSESVPPRTVTRLRSTELIDLTQSADALVSSVISAVPDQFTGSFNPPLGGFHRDGPVRSANGGNGAFHNGVEPGTDTTDTCADDRSGSTSTAEDLRPEPLIRFRASDGSWVRLALRRDVSADDDADVVAGALITVEQAHADLTVSEWFTKLVENDPAGCLILEFANSADPMSLTIRATNATARNLFNLHARHDHNLSLEQLLAGSSAQLVRSAVFDVYHTGETITAERLSFSEIPGTYLDMRVVRLDDGAVGVVFKDVTSVVAMEARLRKQASHDALTGLPSRSLLEERLDPAAAKASYSDPVAVILVDIVGLSDINEDYGLNYGDDLLRQVGERLVRDVSGLSVVARFGDDEFALVTHGCCSSAEAIDVATMVAAELRHPFDIRGHLVDVGFYLGMAIAPDHGHDARTLLRNASAALRDAKHSTDGLVVFDRGGESHSIRRLAVLSELRESLANNQLELRFQPQLDLRTGRVRKVEAVPRWTDDREPSRMSVELLELAEQSALIQPLTRWLLTEATLASRQLERTVSRPLIGSDPLVVSLNLSPRNLFDPDLESFLEWMVRSGELRPGQLELEVNEPGLMDDPTSSQETLERLSQLGIKFVVDEFGTGYTSLATMRHLAVEGLKIDRSYLVTIASAPSDAAVIRSTIELCHELGLFAAATGVTDLEVLSLLVDFGCDFAQGPFLSEPVTLADLPGRIAELEEIARAWLGAGLHT